MIIMLIALLVLVAALGGGFYLHVQQLIASAPKPTPATVSTMKVENQTWQPQMTAVGSLWAVNGVDLSSEVAGVVKAIPVTSGTAVQRGDRIIALNSDADQAQLASLQASADLAASVLARDQAQLPAKAVSEATVASDAANLRSTKALVEQQKALIAQKTIRAPFAGDLGIIQVNLGQYITPGQLIVTLQDLSSMHVDFLVPQDRIGAVAVGQTVNVDTNAFPGKEFSGKVDAINSKVDPATRNVTIRATVPNTDGLLRPGMFVRVTLQSGKPQQRLTLPQTAITFNSYGATVFIVKPASEDSEKTDTSKTAASGGAPPPKGSDAADEGATGDAAQAKGLVAEQVFVTTGERRGDQVAIVKGLSAGQVVVTSGQLKLKTGSSVVIDNSVQPANDPAPTPQEQ